MVAHPVLFHGKKAVFCPDRVIQKALRPLKVDDRVFALKEAGAVAAVHVAEVLFEGQLQRGLVDGFRPVRNTTHRGLPRLVLGPKKALQIAQVFPKESVHPIVTRDIFVLLTGDLRVVEDCLVFGAIADAVIHDDGDGTVFVEGAASAVGVPHHFLQVEVADRSGKRQFFRRIKLSHFSSSLPGRASPETQCPSPRKAGTRSNNRAKLSNVKSLKYRPLRTPSNSPSLKEV